jgi:alpha-L-arabinofuranosidase
VPDHEAQISVHPDRRGAAIPATLYGLHLEHIWNCVYGSLWVGPEAAIANTDGIRDDVVALLRQLRPAVCKYPGGYFSDFYDWRDGTGARERRPVRTYPCEPGRIEPNQFGTAEFVRFCRLLGAEPFLSVNTTSLNPSDAAAWVEYCNVRGGTYWSDRRIADGHVEPFGVKYWAIGNEQYWLHPAADYAHRFRLWSHWMYNTDPGICLVMSGLEPGLAGLAVAPFNADGRWAAEVLRLTESGNAVFPARWHLPLVQRGTLYSIHPYFGAPAECTPAAYYAALEDLDTRLNRSIPLTVQMLEEHRGKGPRPKLCLDEYGLLHPGTRMDGNMTQPAPYWAAVWLARFLQICHRYAADIGMATHPGAINMEHALVLVDGDKAFATPSFHAFRMLREHAGCTRVKTDSGSLPRCAGLGSAALAMVASLDEPRQRVLLTVVNLDLEHPVTCRLAIPGRRVTSAQRELLTSADPNAANSASSPARVAPVLELLRWAADGPVVTFPACSVTNLAAVLE